MTKGKEIKYKLAVYLPYLQLMTSLDPTERGIINQEVKNSLIEAWDFLKTANAKELINKGPKLITSLKKLVEKYEEFARPKLPLEKISEAITGKKDQWEIPLGLVGEKKTEKELERLRILLELEAKQIDYYR